MKVLLCTPYKGITPTNPGGIAIWAKNINAYYENNKEGYIEMDICPMDRTRESGDLSFPLRIWYGIKDYIPAIRAIKRLTKHETYDLVHLCSSAQIGLIRDIIILRITNRRHIPAAVHFHFGRLPQIFQRKNWEYHLIKEVIKRTDKVVVMDKASYTTLQEAGYDNIEYLANPLAPEILRQIETANTSQSREPGRILFAGHVIPSKGIYELVTSCAKIPETKLLVLGQVDANTENELKQQAENIRGNANWLEFTHAVPHERVIEEMQKCNIFALPSYTEGFPNVILEAMACRCPIIATPVGAIPEMLDFGTAIPLGREVAIQDEQSLTQGLQELLQDPTTSSNMAEAAAQRVLSQYAMPVIWTRLTTIWETAINKA